MEGNDVSHWWDRPYVVRVMPAAWLRSGGKYSKPEEPVQSTSSPGFYRIEQECSECSARWNPVARSYVDQGFRNCPGRKHPQKDWTAALARCEEIIDLLRSAGEDVRRISTEILV